MTDEEVFNNVVVSSRVRLARNIVQYPFSNKLSDKEAESMLNEFLDVLSKSTSPLLQQLKYSCMSDMSVTDKISLVEKHLISKEFASKKDVTGLFLNKDESISLMINEEDHLRIQAISRGLQIKKCWERCDEIDNAIEEKLEYAFSDKVGYLTSCPTNVGTGLRVSVMIHLPALTIMGYLKNVLDTVLKLGTAVRGLYGEGSEALGNMFQFSNQITLGQSEEELITKVDVIAHRIIEQELLARENLMKNRIFLEDRLFRSFGVFSNSRVMSSNECMNLLSDVRLGVELDIIKDIDIETINELMVITQPANLQILTETELSQEERDIKRSEIIRIKIRGDKNV